VSVFQQLSIVIPIGLNDTAWQPLQDILAAYSPEIEIILSACQAAPESSQWSKNTHWIQGEQGRAKQLNAGAAQASRPVIWFLHADTQVSSEVIAEVQDYLQSSRLSLGYFRLKFSLDGPKQMGINAWGANLRSRYLGLPFGDQGFILSQTVLTSLQGFDESLSLGEDLDFVVRAKAAGVLLQELNAELLTSARRYQQQGWLRTTLRFIRLTFCLRSQAQQRLAKRS